MNHALAISCRGIPFALLLFASPAAGWEATRSGPILDKARIAELMKQLAGTTAPPAVVTKRKAAGSSGNKAKRRTGKATTVPERIPIPALTADRITPRALLNRRTVEYPHQSGARLADGWDFITNTRIYSQCIDYGTAYTDGYQQAGLDYRQSVDEETFSVSLNINTSANVSGGIGNFSGKAEGTFNIDTSYKLVSKDDVIVAHASVVNGASYVTAQTAVQAQAGQSAERSTSNNGSGQIPSFANPATKEAIAGVKLSAGALRLLGGENGREMFRAACGDGFVAAIGTGADLYLLYHFAMKETDKRLQIVTSMKAGGGVSGVFTAGGSMESTLKLSELVKEQRLGIYYIQQGGAIGALPTKVEDIGARVAALPGEALKNGRPLYVILVPYSELYNWPLNFEPSELIDLRTSLVRYLRRLRYAFNELQAIIADFRTYRGTPGTSEYMHDSLHRLRAVDYSVLNDELQKEIKMVERAIRTIDAHCVKRTSRTAALECGQAMTALFQHPNTQQEEGKEEEATIDTNDFRFLVRLPVPRNIIDPSLAKLLEARDGDVEDRKYFYSMQLYKHWIERISAERCALFSECLDEAKRTDAYQQIKSSLNM
ncbi:hypothetical protein ABIF74_010002 [Bradyrhizobium japonicum]